MKIYEVQDPNRKTQGYYLNKEDADIALKTVNADWTAAAAATRNLVKKTKELLDEYEAADLVAKDNPVTIATGWVESNGEVVRLYPLRGRIVEHELNTRIEEAS